MSVEFSAKISMLRKEKNVSQRQASEELGISQALLSHYEKGIRECNLDFVKKAASYYGVTSDFLLGITENRRGVTDIYLPDDLEDDGEISRESIVRSIIYLFQRAQQYGDGAQSFFYDYFALSIKKYASLLSGEPANVQSLNDFCAELLINEKREDKKKRQDLSDCPAALKTVNGHAQSIISERLQSAI